MPPTYSPWWKPFEILGAMGLARRRISASPVLMGPVGATDCFGGEDWRAFSAPEALFEVWGPPAASPWSAYHRPTLFAALDSVPKQSIWPAQTLPVVDAPRRAPAWINDETAIVVDLPGVFAVAYAAWLAQRGGHVPVVTFNNWPHAKGLVDMGKPLGALLYYAPWVRQSEVLADESKAPPVFALDRSRLGTRPPVPHDFDNRYYLLETDLPAGPVLAARGITQLVYVRPEGSVANDEMDDLNVWLHDLNERVAVHVAEASLASWSLGEPRRYAPAIRKTPFSTTKDPAFRGFRRNAAGGFGVLVPEPSSGGG